MRRVQRLRWAGLALAMAGQALMLLAPRRPVFGLLILAGLVLLLYTWRRAPLREPAPAQTGSLTVRPALMALAFALALALSYRVVVPTEALVGFLPQDSPLLDVLIYPPSHAEQIVLWLLSMGLFVLGAASPFRRLPSPFVGTSAWVLALLVAVAFAARVVNLEEGVPVLFVDEAPFAAHAREIAEDGRRMVLFGPSHYSHPALFEGMLAPFVGAMGRTRAAARMAPALIGTLTVPALYWLGAELFGRRVGMAAAAFLALHPVHVHFSRLAINNIVDPFFMVLGIAALVRGWRRGGSGWFALAGVMLGLTQYFYAAARIVPLLVAALLWRQRRKQAPPANRAVPPAEAGGEPRGRRLWGVALAAAGFLLATLPHNAYLFAHQQPLTRRLTASFDRAAFLEGTLEEVVQQKLIPAALAFTHTPDAFYFYGGYTPVLLYLPAVAFLVGVGWLLLHWRRPRALLLLGWVWVPAGLAALLREVPGYARLVITLPAVALVVALGLERVVWHVSPRLRRHGWRALAAALVAIGAANAAYYFGTHRADFIETGAVYSEIGWWMYLVGETARALPTGTKAVFLTEPELIHNTANIYSYHNGGAKMWWPAPDPFDTLRTLDESGPPYVVFFSAHYRDEITKLQLIRPEGQTARITAREAPPDAAPLFRFFLR